MNVTKKITVAIMTIFCVIFAAFAVSCSGGKVEISFETGGVVAVESVKVAKNEEYTLPAITATGYEFLGWYDNADYKGSVVTSVKPTAKTTYYAKWEKLAKVTIDLNGGSGTSGDVYVKLGSSLSEGLKSYTPSKPGYQFGRWLLDGKEVTSSTKAADGITVKADYKVGYTVEVYLESLDGKSYEKKAENVNGYDYIQKNYAPSYTEVGFVQTTNAAEVVKKDLSATPSENVYKIYFNRKTIEITYRPEYPDGSEGSDFTDTLKYGQTKYVEATNVKRDGYVLVGWATEKGGEVKYATNFFELEGVVRNHDGEYGNPDALSSVTEDVVLYGKWIKARTDMLGGNDYIYRLADDEEHLYLCRDGEYFIGQLVDNDFSFRTVDEETGKEKEIFNGRLVDDTKFIYGNLDRASLIFSCFDKKTTGKVNNDITIQFGEYNDLIYNDKSTNEQSRGVYVVNEKGFYEVTYNDGPLAGTSMVFIAGYVNDSNNQRVNVFVTRNEDEYNYGRLHRFYVNNRNEVDYRYVKEGILDIKLDGFSTATFYNYDSTTGEVSEVEYVYSSNVKTGLITLSSSSNGQSVGTIKLMDVTIDGKTIKGYDFYTATEALTFTLGSSTLTLDGTFNATYFDGTNNLTGYYTLTQSALGNVVKFYDKEAKKDYTFLTNTITSQKVITDENGKEKTETVIEYVFERKANGYVAYKYSDETGKYRAPLLIINDTVEGGATMYAYSKKGTYVKVSSGTVKKVDDKNVYTADTFYDVNEEVFETLMKFQDVTSFVYDVQGEFAYFYSYTTKDNVTTDLSKKEVTYKSDNSTDVVKTFGGFLFFKQGGDNLVSAYTVDEATGLAVAAFNNVKTYFELDEANKKFVKLAYAPYTASIRKSNGDTDATETLSFDGKGGAVYAKESADSTKEAPKYDFNFKGTITEAGKSDVSGADTYLFTYTTEAGTAQFKYVILTASSKVYFAKYEGNEDGVNNYVSDYGVLTLDGFGFRANYTDADGVMHENCAYLVSSEKVIMLSIDGKTRYFDISDNSFSVRGIEYGKKIYVDNYNTPGLFFDFDGYSNVKVYTLETVKDSDGKDVVKPKYIDEKGTYVAIGDSEYRVKYTDGSDAITIEGKLSALRAGNGVYAAFVKTYSEVVSTYVNPVDFSVVRLDGNGNVVKTLKTGTKQSGQYVVVTDNLIYFVNSDGTDACLYSYDKATGTIRTVTDNYIDMSFYTSNLESLKFSKHGYAVFNGDTRYYYVINENGEYVIYRYAKDGETANKYGLVSEVFCTQEEYLGFTEGNVKQYEGKQYYFADGWSIDFNRTEENKDKYPAPVSNGSAVVKKPFEKLTFSPGGGTEFSVNGRVVLDGKTYSCVVNKVAVKTEAGEPTGKYETYVTLSGFRFDVNLTYGGVNAEGDSRSTYEVTSLEYSRFYYAYNYLDLYYMLYMYFGASMANRLPNGYGSMTYKVTYDEKGEEVTAGYDCVFGDYAGLVDLKGNKFTAAENAKENTDFYGFKYIDMKGTDGFDYRLHFTMRNHSAFNMAAYTVVAFTRVQTFDGLADGHTATVEKVIYSDVAAQFPVASVYSVDLMKGESKITFSERANYNGVWYGIHRDIDETTKKITNTVYYELGFVDNDDAYTTTDSAGKEQVLSAASYASATLNVRPMKTYYWVSGENMYVDVDETNNTIFLLYRKATTGAGSYIVTEQTYDEATKTHTITAGGKQYTVKIKEDGTAEINAIED